MRNLLQKIDDSLLTRIAANDKNAFCELYELAGTTVYAFALSILKNPADAEDVKQDCFIQIRRAAASYRPENRALSWILSIVKNLCLMKLRREKFHSVFSIDDFPFEEPFQEIDRLEDRLVLKTALHILSEEESAIVCLHAVTGLKHREIAGILDLPLSTVLSKYRRGLKKLRNELEGIL